eukprot:5775023-Lingulodinium_polyedra.AAC.1
MARKTPARKLGGGRGGPRNPGRRPQPATGEKRTAQRRQMGRGGANGPGRQPRRPKTHGRNL